MTVVWFVAYCSLCKCCSCCFQIILQLFLSDYWLLSSLMRLDDNIICEINKLNLHVTTERDKSDCSQLQQHVCISEAHKTQTISFKRTQTV